MIIQDKFKRNDIMTFIKSLQKMNKNNLAQIYVLQGTESYFIDQFKTKIIQLLKDDVNDDIATYDLLEVPIQHIVNDLETLPFFNERKLVFAYYPNFLKTKSEKLAFTHDLEVLEGYLNNPAPFSTLVLVAPYEKFDERKKITKQIKKVTTVVNCNPISPNEIRKWIFQLAESHNISITQEACNIMEAEFQTNLQLIEKELEKLALFIGPGGEITREIALDNIATSLTHNALELVDAVLKKDLHKAIVIYKELEMMKEEPIGLIALLSYQFRIIYQVKILQDKGLPNQSIQGVVKAHPYVIKLASERARRFNYSQLTNIINELTFADTAIKRGKMDKAIAFELLLFKLTTAI